MLEGIKDLLHELGNDLHLSKSVEGLEHLIYHIIALLPYLIIISIVYDVALGKGYFGFGLLSTVNKIVYFIFTVIIGGLSWILNVSEWRRLQ